MTPLPRKTVSGSLSPDPAESPERLTLSRRLHHWAFRQPSTSSRIDQTLRTAARILLIMYAEFFRTHITIRASALTFSIILSLVPMLALSTSILKGLGNDDRLRQAAIRLIDQLEPAADIPVQQPATETGAAAPGEAVTPPDPPAHRPANALTAHLHQAVDAIFAYVARTNFAALGLVGVLGLIVVVLLVLSSIEDAMNAIWHTRKGRSILRKLMDYLALLILLPISINIALAAEAVLASERIMERISLIVPTAWVAALLIKFVPFLFVVLTLMFLYLFFPHVRVKTGPAFIGAVFAAACWFIVQKLYFVLQVGVANYNAIYGSFATVPLFLVWLQIGWTFILLGALLAYAMQHHSQYDFLGAPQSPQRQLQTAFDILQLVYANFAARSPTTTPLLQERIPQTRLADIETVVRILISGQILCVREENGDDLLLPLTPAENLNGREIVELILGCEQLPTEGGHLAGYAIAAAGGALTDHPVFAPPSPQERHGQGIEPDPS